MRSLLERPDARLQFAGHETFPCRYGWLKKSFDAIALAPNDGARHAAFSPDYAIAEFGVGKNMVASMRHWALAFGILEANGVRGKLLDIVPTEFGRLIFLGGDPYLERSASLWALHWKLASNPGRATTWYFAFNEFNESIFTKDTLASRLMARIDNLRDSGKLSGSRIAHRTVERDVECLVRTYLPKSSSRAAAEDSLECPFAELGLLAAMPGVGAVQFRRGPKPTLPDDVFVYALADFWRNQFDTRGSLALETVTHEPGSPGRVFLLDEDSVAERLEGIERISGGAFSWDESSGLRQVTARHPVRFIESTEFLARVYRNQEMAI